MTQWNCSKCKEAVVNKNVPTTMQGMIGFEKGYVCPTCKAKCLTEETVTVSILTKELKGGAKMD